VVTKSNIMAKRIRNNQVPVEKSENSKVFIRSTNTQNLAFVVPAGSLNELLNETLPPIELLDILPSLVPDQVNNARVAITENNLEYYLTGLQFEFIKEQGERVVNVLQVYYVKNIDVFFRYRDQSNNGIIQSLSNNYKHTIIENRPIFSQNISHFTLEDGNTASQLNFQNLDFFNDHSGESVNFVYFAIDQIKPLVQQTAKTEGEIILSGSSLDFGRKLSPDGENTLYEGMYFSLKMEGKSGAGSTSGSTSGNTSGSTSGNTSGGNNAEITEPPGIAISVPCPPEWFFSYNLFVEARKMNEKASYPELNNGQIRIIIIKNELGRIIIP